MPGPHALERGTFVMRAGSWSWLVHRRALQVTLVLAVFLAAACAFAVAAGDTWLSAADARALWTGRAAPGLELLVWEFRAPRVLVAVLAGAALGLAGTLLQTLLHNRLASPDVMGVSDGATVALTVALLAGSNGLLGPWWVAVAGALAAALALLVLSGGMGTRGQRLLIVGLAVAALLRAATEWLLSRENVQDAGAIYAWSMGSLSGRGMASALPLGVGLAVCLPAAWALSRRLHVLRLDADVAAGLGVPVRPVQLQALLLAITAAGLAVGVCGPVAFVALSAPWLSDRLHGGGRVALLGAALCGAALVVLADAIGRLLLPSGELPVGVVCNLLGGPFLLWMLTRTRTE